MEAEEAWVAGLREILWTERAGLFSSALLITRGFSTFSLQSFTPSWSFNHMNNGLVRLTLRVHRFEQEFEGVNDVFELQVRSVLTPAPR